VSNPKESPRCRRRFQRAQVRGDIGLEDEAGVRDLARLYDISHQGLCVHTQKPMPKDKIYRAAFLPGAEEAPIVLKGRVAWNSQEQDVFGATRVLNGIEFMDLPLDREKIIRKFIDQRTSAIYTALGLVQEITEFSDEEQRIVATACVDRTLKSGQNMEMEESTGAIIMIRSGSVHYRETSSVGETLTARSIAQGQICGYPPIDPRGLPITHIVALQEGAVTYLPPDAFHRIQKDSPTTVVKLLSALCISLLERLRLVKASKLNLNV